MGRRLYVGNLAWTVTDQDLQDAFSEAGKVDSSQVIMDRATNRSRGFGFVEMASDEAADAAIKKLNGRDIKGRPIRVNEAQARSNNRASDARLVPFRSRRQPARTVAPAAETHPILARRSSAAPENQALLQSPALSLFEMFANLLCESTRDARWPRVSRISLCYL